MSDDAWMPQIGAVTLIVADLEASKAFYAKAFGAPLAFESDDSAVFRLGAVMINLLHRSSAEELLAPVRAGHVGDGARIVFTVPVPDVDAWCAGLAERGITVLSGPVTRPWGPRTASFADPDGHVWEIAS